MCVDPYSNLILSWSLGLFIDINFCIDNAYMHKKIDIMDAEKICVMSVDKLINGDRIVLIYNIFACFKSVHQ